MNSLTDLLNAAAAALAARDGDRIQRLAATAADWLQPESEAEAQRHLLEGEESEFASAEGEAE